jgi:hypothetical protein
MKNYIIFQYFFGLMLLANTAYAIDLQPGEIAAPPIGIKLAQYSYQYSQRGDFYRSGDKFYRDSEMKTSSYTLRLGSAFELANMPAIWYVQSDVRNMQVDLVSPNVSLAKAAGMDVNGDVGGSDTSLLVAVWPYADRVAKKYLGVAAYLIVPTGAYSNDRLFNVGENRYKTALQVGYQTQLTEPLSAMVAFDAVFFGDNDRYTVSNFSLKQDHLYTLQTGLKYNLNQRYSVALAYFHSFGGETEINRNDMNDRLSIHRYQLTAQGDYDFGRITLHYGSDLKTASGMIEDHRLIMRYTSFF